MGINTGVQHVMLVCAYKEPVDVLKMTIGSIRDQKGHIAPSAIEVVVAMEFKDDTRDATFQALMDEFMPEGGTPTFKRLIQTVHKLDDAGIETAGKSSNENHAVRELFKMKTAEGISPFKVLVTICDADSLFAPEYFAQLDYTWTQYPSPELLIYDGPLNTYRNFFEAEFLIQAFETMRCAFQATTVWRQWKKTCGVTSSDWAPMESAQSNYSLTLGLAHNIEYWCPDNTPEDLHTQIKAFVYTNGSITTVPVFSVISNDLVTGYGDRYTQAKRHSWGVTEAAWLFCQEGRVPHAIFAQLSPLIYSEQLLQSCEFGGMIYLVFPGVWQWFFALSPLAQFTVVFVAVFKQCVSWMGHVTIEFNNWVHVLPNNPKFPRTTGWQWCTLYCHWLLFPVMQKPVILMFEWIPRIDAMIHSFRSTKLAYITAPKALSGKTDVDPKRAEHASQAEGDFAQIPVVVN